ncbi:hypothetical protein ACN38_g8833 [Penicillium nordicum]|uniref:Uncharacterized protein n=1 Tax=Penicillium nordicum TaxID=229535 RepID=A0A0M9WD41_9EURO|nr:hypothetical protein ACN38_g8833 [Penicillium nordicum]
MDDRLDVRPGADIYIFPWALSSESGSRVSVHLGRTLRIGRVYTAERTGSPVFHTLWSYVSFYVCETIIVMSCSIYIGAWTI